MYDALCKDSKQLIKTAITRLDSRAARDLYQHLQPNAGRQKLRVMGKPIGDTELQRMYMSPESEI